MCDTRYGSLILLDESERVLHLCNIMGLYYVPPPLARKPGKNVNTDSNTQMRWLHWTIWRIISNRNLNAHLIFWALQSMRNGWNKCATVLRDIVVAHKIANHLYSVIDLSRQWIHAFYYRSFSNVIAVSCQFYCPFGERIKKSCSLSSS